MSDSSTDLRRVSFHEDKKKDGAKLEKKYKTSSSPSTDSYDSYTSYSRSSSYTATSSYTGTDSGGSYTSSVDRRDGAYVALENAKTIIDEQRLRIGDLSKTLVLTDEKLSQVTETYRAEHALLVEENEKLRLHVTSLNAEVAAIGEVQIGADAEVAKSQTSLLAAEKGIQMRDRKIQELTTKLGTYPEENKKLKQYVSELLKQSQTPLVHPQAFTNLQEQLKEARKELEAQKLLSKQVDHVQEESRITKKCIIQMESDCSENQRLVERQRAEIQKLCRVIESLNKEKSLMPPVVLALPKPDPPPLYYPPPPEEQKEAIRSKSNDDRFREARHNEEEREITYRDRSAIATQQLLVLEEQKDLMDRLFKKLEGVVERQIHRTENEITNLPKNVFYSGKLMHVLEDDVDTTYVTRIASILAGELKLHADLDGEHEAMTLLAHRVAHAISDPDGLQFRFEYVPVDSGEIVSHVFQASSQDDYNKWLHGLEYGGFLRTQVRTTAQPEYQPPKQEVKTLPSVKDFVPAALGLPRTNVVLKASDGSDIVLKNETISLEDNCGTLRIGSMTVPTTKCKFFQESDNNQLIIQVTKDIGPDQVIRMNFSDPYEFNHAALYLAPAPWGQAVKQAVIPKAVQEAIPEPVAQAEEPEDDGPQEDQFVVKDGKLMLFERDDRDNPVLLLDNEDCFTTADPVAGEFTIVYKQGTNEEETYVFAFPDPEIFKKYLQELEENQFFKLEGTQHGARPQQIALVTKGRVELYTNYGVEGAKPMMSLPVAACQAVADAERQEIRIIHAKPDGTKERITLSCSTAKDFERWKVALNFSGFLKATHKKGNDSAYKNFSKYIFPIKVFGNKGSVSSGRASALQIRGTSLCYFADSEATTPVMEFPVELCQLKIKADQRNIRLYKNRGTEDEERVDFVLALSDEFVQLTKTLQELNFPADSGPQKVNRKTEKPFVLCKKGLIAVYSSKTHSSPVNSFGKNNYTHTINEKERTIIFKHNTKEEKAVYYVNASNAASFEKWILCLKVAMFLKFSDEPPKKLFHPKLVYGFVNVDAQTLVKKKKRMEGILSACEAMKSDEAGSMN